MPKKKAQPRTERRGKDQPLTAASLSTTVDIKNAVRMNVLDELNKKSLDFKSAAKYMPVWDALIGGWNWDEMIRGPIDFGAVKLDKDAPFMWPEGADQAGFKAHLKAMDELSGHWEEVELDKQVIVALRDLIKEKLEESAPKNGKPDRRWTGRNAMNARRLYDRLQYIVEGVES